MGVGVGDVGEARRAVAGGWVSGWLSGRAGGRAGGAGGGRVYPYISQPIMQRMPANETPDKAEK